MLNHSMRAWLLLVCGAVVAAQTVMAADPTPTAAVDARASMTKSQIDLWIEQAAAEKGLTPAAICSDEQFIRRVSLDLIGRIPNVQERAAFLANPDRAAWVDTLLASEEFPRVWADLWTTQWYGYESDGGSDREALAQWVEDQVRLKQPYDTMVKTLISASGESAFDGSVNFLLRHSEEPVVKISRSFLGVRLDCARCHDHPFDRWTQDDFTRMSRFFEAIEQQEISQGNTRLVDIVREVDESERPRFLTGAQPRTTQWRAEFSLFLVKSRPFARNFANRLWYHFLGRGIVHPVDNVNRENPPVLPELLEGLTDEVLASDFDLRGMIKKICLSEAYQRQSLAARGDEDRQNLFLVRTIKPLLPEQWYASMCTATGRPANAEERMEFIRSYHGGTLNADFSSSWDYRETTSGLMSRLVEEITPPATRPEDLFIAILGRLPTDEEQSLCQACTPKELCFVLLHSSEFAFNH